MVFVRPILEHASSVWDPHTKKYADKIESTRMRAARFVPSRYHNASSVSAMMNRLRRPTLQQRRRAVRLPMLWKTKNNLVHTEALACKLEPLPDNKR